MRTYLKTGAVIMLIGLMMPMAGHTQAASDPETLKNEGNLLYRDGKIDEAIAKWEEAIAADSTYSFAYNNIGIALYDKQDYAGSARYLEQAVAIDTTYAKAFNSLGNAYLAEGRYDDARAAYETAVRFEPRNVDARTNLGNTYLTEGRYDSAMDAYTRALDIDKNHVPALNNRGLILWRRGKLDEAVESFRDAVKADAQFIDALINLGMVYLDYDDPDGKYKKSSIDYLTRAYEMAPENRDIIFNLSLHYLRTGNASKSRQLTEQLVALTPGDPVAHYLQGHAYALGKMYEQAYVSFTEAFRLDPGFTRARIAIDETSQIVNQ